VSAPGTLALVFVSAWIGALSVISALLVRQVGLLTYRVDPDYSLDGLAVGRRFPRLVTDLLPGGSGIVMVLGAGCSPCRELVHGLRGLSVEGPVVAIIEGDETLAAALVEELPAGVQPMIGDEAGRAYSALDLQTTPFLFSVDQRKIVHKTVLRGAPHFVSFLQQPETVPTSRPQAQTVELPYVD
jgi:hypothetical protein